MNVQDFIDYKLRCFLDSISDEEEVVQVTLRIPTRIKHQADAVSTFMSMSRNALFSAILDDGIRVAFDRLNDNPVCTAMKVNDMTLDEYHASLLAGKTTVREPLSQEEIEAKFAPKGV